MPLVAKARDRGASLPECNHRTLAILVLAFGIVGGLLDVVAPPPMVRPRFALFLCLFVGGVVYLWRVVRRSRRGRLGRSSS